MQSDGSSPIVTRIYGKPWLESYWYEMRERATVMYDGQVGMKRTTAVARAGRKEHSSHYVLALLWAPPISSRYSRAPRTATLIVRYLQAVLDGLDNVQSVEGPLSSGGFGLRGHCLLQPSLQSYMPTTHRPDQSLSPTSCEHQEHARP